MATTIPADVTYLVALLARLGFDLGALKAFDFTGDDVVNTWFVHEGSPDQIKRARARLVTGYENPYWGTLDGCHMRRAYMDLRIQYGNGEWTTVSDSDYVEVGLEEPWRYAGKHPLAVVLVNGYRIEVTREYGFDLAGEPDKRVIRELWYYPHLSGDLECAQARAERIVDEYVNGPDELRLAT